MKLHQTLVEKLVNLFTTFGGWQGEKKLYDELGKLNIATYTQQSSGEVVLVDGDELAKAIREMSTTDV
jgi:hypothetical protein